jgi:hypothetical protein
VLREAAQVEKVKETDYSHSNSDNWVHALIMQGLNAGGRIPILPQRCKEGAPSLRFGC